MTQPLDFVAVQARHDAATPGEWNIHPDWPGRVFSTNGHIARCTGFKAEENAAAIVVAHNAMPALLARVAELEAELASARAAAFTEAARLLEDTGRDDDSVNLLDNVAEGIRSHATP
jgi:hypothetical protein